MDIEDSEQLLAYLSARGESSNLEIKTLSGGVSNRVVLVSWPSGVSWVIKQALSKLRVAVDWYSSPERIHVEALALHYLNELGVAVPRLEFEDRQHHLLAMDAVPLPHDNWKLLLLSGHVVPAHVHSFAEMLASIHTRSSARRTELEPVFRDTSVFESLRLEPYYGYTAEQVPEVSGFLHGLIDATRTHRLCLVHGDFSPKNVLVRDGQLILLDHEVCHWGDPAFDIGFALTHLLSKAHHVRGSRASLRQSCLAFWRTYESIVRSQVWAAELKARAVSSVLGCLLARVAGRSPLEYLGELERVRQRAVVVAMIRRRPRSIPSLVEGFVEQLQSLEASEAR